MATTKPTYTEPEAYKSQYGDQIAAGIDKVTNREAFSYDPLKDANYQAMAKIYTQQGNKAAKDTLGDAASLNGGYGSSYAVTASQQVRNDYNQQLASQIPALEQAAYGKWKDSYDMDVTNLQLLQDADDRDYGRYRDDVADSQWKYGQDYQAYRDNVADEQWQTSFDYQQKRDNVADQQWQTSFDYQKGRDAVADQQWQTEYDRGVYESNRDYKYQKSRDKVADSQWAKEYKLAKKNSATSSKSSSSGYIGSSKTSNYSNAKTTASSSVSARAKRNAKARTANASKTTKTKKK